MNMKTIYYVDAILLCEKSKYWKQYFCGSENIPPQNEYLLDIDPCNNLNIFKDCMKYLHGMKYEFSTIEHLKNCVQLMDFWLISNKRINLIFHIHNILPHNILPHNNCIHDIKCFYLNIRYGLDYSIIKLLDNILFPKKYISIILY